MPVFVTFPTCFGGVFVTFPTFNAAKIQKKYDICKYFGENLKILCKMPGFLVWGEGN